MKKLFTLVSLFISTFAFGAQNSTLNDIEAVNGYVKFYVTQSPSAARATMNILTDVLADSTLIKVNGSDYYVRTDSEGKKYISVKEATDSIYQAVLMNSTATTYFKADGISNVILPCSQFYNTTIKTFKNYPMYAEYTKETGNELNFTDGFALLDVAITGSKYQLKGIHVENLGKGNIAGISNYSFADKAWKNSAEGAPYIAYNCVNKGSLITLRAAPRHFYIPILPGKYDEGLKIRVSDMTHKMMEINVDGQEIKSNQVVSVSAKYAPDDDLVFFEGFDNLIWGGDYMGTSTTGKRFSPTGTNPGTSANTTLTGYEEALTPVYNYFPGSGYMQSNTFSDVSGLTVKNSHITSDSYLTSRGLMDYYYLYRCQEYSGFMGVGVANTGRGIFNTPNWTEIETTRNITVSFDVAFSVGFNDKLDIQIANGGYIKKAYIDGVEETLTDNNCMYSGISSHLILPYSRFKIPSATWVEKKWYHITLEVEQASTGTNLYLQGYTTAISGKHGFFVDNIDVRKSTETPLERGNLRLLYWNIQNGMWADQGNSYTNFVNWVKEYDPDICVWCEARSNLVTGTSTSLSTSSSYLPNMYSSSDTNEGWKNLALRYGHNYAALGGHRDNFPQEITSKYPITTILKITNTDNSSKPIAHGAAIQQVDVNGTKLNFVTLHTWPHAYGYGVSSDNQSASAAANEGDYYREYEMNYIVDHTYLSSDYKDFTNWITLGDFNSVSPVDDYYYGYGSESTKYLCQSVMRDKTDMKDVIAEIYPGMFMSSTHGNSRIDYVYTSPDIFKYIKNAMIIKDDWTTTVYTGISNYYLPSDHRPILIDFNLPDPTGINSTKSSNNSKTEAARYDAAGRRIFAPQKGVTIIKYSDGSARKVVVK